MSKDMREVTEYDVVQNSDYFAFIAEVNGRIRAGGWQPWGALTVLMRKVLDDEFEQVYVQAMVRYAFEDDD